MLKLFLTFFKIGCTTFGGGFAMVPIFEAECEKNNWATSDEMMEALSVAQVVPGIVAIKMAVYVGKKIYGIRGVFVAAIAVVLPSLLLVTLFMFLIENFNLLESRSIQKVMTGIRAGVLALIVNVFIRLFKTYTTNIYQFILFIIGLALLLVHFSPYKLIFVVSIIGVLQGELEIRKAKKESKAENKVESKEVS